ncbi:AMP-binding protein [Pseudonocardia sp. H11422]|uniref:AMP-binding protein n=1 Tax=Pseudonocardia sp. H11422 TaxID=2835866 RepID=UPI0027E3252C|nr:AMP-binding protein [Pseudonocardia sp. H11422]
MSTALAAGLRALAAAAPDAPAVSDDEERVTRAELEERTNRLARAFAARGVRRGSLVTIALPNRVRHVEASVAAWKLGAVPQPVSHRLPPGELDALIAVADPALVVGLQPRDRRPWLPGDHDASGESAQPLPDVVGPSWKAPTSGGSTGRPKIIVSGQEASLEAVVPRAAPLRIDRDGVMLCTAPLYHNAPYMFSLLALLQGHHVVLMGRFDAERTLRLVAEHGVTWLYVVPTMMGRMLRLPGEVRRAADLSSLRTVLHVGAPCPPHVKRGWLEWCGPETVLELYSGTEAQANAMITGAEWLARPGSVGQVKAGRMKVRDAEGRELPPGEIGEIWMRPVDDRRTYHYIGAEPRERDGWESLGDMGHFDADGYLYLADRRTDMILVGGANVYPAEVEAALYQHPAVLTCAVIGLPDDDYGNIVHAIVQAGGPVDATALLTHLAGRLAPYKIPRTVEFTDEAVRDDAGKVRRSALRAARLPTPGRAAAGD